MQGTKVIKEAARNQVQRSFCSEEAKLKTNPVISSYRRNFVSKQRLFADSRHSNRLHIT